MAAPSMVVRIAANLEELKRNLAEGRNQIEATTAGMQKLASSFQGDRIIQAAHNAAAAVERIGGASKLTEAEQERVNATVQRALDKYAALGREAPKALRDLAEQTKQAEEKTSFLATAAGRLMAAFSVAALANVATKVIDLTGRLTDLAGKTGINTDGLQVMNYTLGQSGVSLDQAARAAVEMGKRLAGGDGAVADALGKLNLNLDQLVAAGPERAFYAIGEAIAGVPDPMQRAALATELFGRTGADLLPAFATNMQAVAEQARASGAIIGADLVQAGDAAGDSLSRLQAVGLTVIANVFLPMAPAIEAVATWLGGALTSGLQMARDGVEGLLLKGLQLNLWLAETAQSITATVAEVPVLGRVFGQTSGDVAYFREMAQHARDTLAAFTSEAATPATAAMTAAAPAAVQFSASLDQVATSSARVRETVGAMQGPSVEFLNLESRTIQETIRLNASLQAWANTNGAVLAPSIRQVNAALAEQTPLMATANTSWATFAPTVQQHTAAATTATGGFMDRLQGFFGGNGDMGKMLQTIGPQFAAAFMGPGSAGDKMKAFATAGMGALLGMIPGVGPWLQAFSGPIVEGLTKLAKKAKDILSGIFGGPSGTELEQRSLVAAFEKDLANGLTATQKLEAGGEAWKETVIRVRDAYLAQGRTAAEAEADVKRLWESSKQGAGATAAAIAEIKRKMEQAADAGEGMADRVTDALERIPRDIDVRVRANVDESYERAPGFSNGSGGVRDFGRGTLAVLHGRERVQTEVQMLAEQRGGGGGGAQGGGGVTVHVDARGALMNDYGSQQQLARLVNDAVMQTLGMQRTLGVAPGVS